MNKYQIFIAGFGAGVVFQASMSFLIFSVVRWRRICRECGTRYREKKSNSQYSPVFCSKVCENVDMHKFLVKHTDATEEEVFNYLQRKEKLDKG